MSDELFFLIIIFCSMLLGSAATYEWLKRCPTEDRMKSYPRSLLAVTMWLLLFVLYLWLVPKSMRTLSAIVALILLGIAAWRRKRK